MSEKKIFWALRGLVSSPNFIGKNGRHCEQIYWGERYFTERAKRHWGLSPYWFFVEDLVHVQTDSREGPVVPHFAAVTLIANKTRGSLRGAGSYFDKFYVSFRFYYLFIARGYLSKFIIPLLRMKQFWNNTKTRLHLGVLLGLHRLRDFDGNQSLRIIDS